MTKNQLTVIWVAVVLLCLTVLFAPKKYVQDGGRRGVWVYDSPQDGAIATIRWDFVLQRSIIILLISGALIYTLKDKKK